MRKILCLVAVFVLSVGAVAQTPPQPSQQAPPTTINPLEDDVQIVEGPILRSVSPTTAELFWRTNNVAATDVRYGLNPNNPEKRKSESQGSREHTVTLTDLTPGQNHYFYIYSRKGEVRAGGQFTTPAQAAVGQPAAIPAGLSGVAVNRAVQDGVQIVRGPELRNATANSVTLAWSTNKNAASDVRYGANSNNLDKRAFESGGSNDHGVQLTGLEPGRTYWFSIQTREGQARATGQFMTPR